MSCEDCKNYEKKPNDKLEKQLKEIDKLISAHCCGNPCSICPMDELYSPCAVITARNQIRARGAKV